MDVEVDDVRTDDAIRVCQTSIGGTINDESRHFRVVARQCDDVAARGI